MACCARMTLTLSVVLSLLMTGVQSQSLAESGKMLRKPTKTTLSSSPADTIVDPAVPWPTTYGVQRTGMIDASFSCFGTFGYNFSTPEPPVPEWPSASFETPPASGKEYLFGGGLWIGGIIGQDTLVSASPDGWSCSNTEYVPPDYPIGSVTRFYYPTHYSMRAEYIDNSPYIEGCVLQEHRPLNIQVANRSHVWRTEEFEDIIIYDMVITNIGDVTIEKTYVGLYMDADVLWENEYPGYTDDLAGSIRDHGIAYVIDNDGDPSGGAYDPETSLLKIFAFRLVASSHTLADTNFNWWVNNSVPTRDFSPRQIGTAEDPFFDFGTGGTGTPEGDANKYYVLSHREWDYDQIFTASIPPDDPVWIYPPDVLDDGFEVDLTNGYDTKFLLSFGPVDLEPDSSIRLILANFTADDVHDFPLNIINLPDHPNGYLMNLNFDDLLTNSGRASVAAEFLSDPLLAPMGLRAEHQDWDSVAVEWDPWVFDNFEGHQIYLSEVPQELIEHPGIAPPWLIPTTIDPLEVTGLPSRYVFDNLDSSKFYFVQVANISSSGTGSKSGPITVCQRGSWPGPIPEDDIVYYYYGDLPEIRWAESHQLDFDHYRIYRFDSTQTARDLYKPFYSTRNDDPDIEPVDVDTAEGVIYYYFAMEPYAVVDPSVTSFQDTDPASGNWYVITAVDTDGFQSEFSSTVVTTEVLEATRDILLITKWPNLELTKFDTVRNFYNAILGEYDYDIYCVVDTVGKYLCDVNDGNCISWRDWSRFKLVIVDFESYDRVFTTVAEQELRRLEQYLKIGGRVAYFGDFYSLNQFTHKVADWYEQNDWLVQPYLGIDSVFFYSVMYYFYNGLPREVDSCFGFSWAEPVVEDFPEIAHDVLRDPWTSFVDYYWWDTSPPSVCVFVENELGEVLYRFRSRDPELSWLEGKPVGVRTVTDETEAYVFGFHLWYMEQEPARQLIEKIFGGNQTNAEQVEAEALPQTFALRQNYPNPFNPSTVISFDLPRAANVTLEIFNVLGQRVTTLIGDRTLSAGTHRIEWRGDDNGGNQVGSGIYFIRLKAGENVATRKMMLLK